MTTNTINTVADYLRDTVDWNKFYSVVDTIGKSLNGAKDRFEKSDLFEGALEAYSKNQEIKYVNENGVDHLLPKINTNLEMKFSSGGLYHVRKPKTEKKVILKDKISSIRLVNTNSDTVRTALPDNYADFLVLVDVNGAAVISKETLKKYLRFGQGHIEAQNIPISEVAIVIGPDSKIKRKELSNFNYKEAKKKFQLDFLSKF
jgi:hypothetical protein